MKAQCNQIANFVLLRKTARHPMRPSPSIPISPVIGNIPPALRLSTDKPQPSESTSVANQQVPVFQPCQQSPAATSLTNPRKRTSDPKYFPLSYKDNSSYVVSLDFVYYIHYSPMTQH